MGSGAIDALKKFLPDYRGDGGAVPVYGMASGGRALDAHDIPKAPAKKDIECDSPRGDAAPFPERHSGPCGRCMDAGKTKDQHTGGVAAQVPGRHVDY